MPGFQVDAFMALQIHGQLSDERKQHVRKIDVVAIEVLVGLKVNNAVGRISIFEVFLEPKEFGRLAAPIMPGKHLARRFPGFRKTDRLCESPNRMLISADRL